MDRKGSAERFQILGPQDQEADLSKSKTFDVTPGAGVGKILRLPTPNRTGRAPPPPPAQPPRRHEAQLPPSPPSLPPGGLLTAPPTAPPSKPAPMAPPSAPLPAAPAASPAQARCAEPWELSCQKSSGGYREWLQARGTQAMQRSLKASPANSPVSGSPMATPMATALLSSMPPVPPLPQANLQSSLQAQPMLQLQSPGMPLLQTSPVSLQSSVSWTAPASNMQVSPWAPELLAQAQIQREALVQAQQAQTQQQWFMASSTAESQMIQQHYQPSMQPMIPGLCHQNPMQMHDCSTSSPTTPASFASSQWMEFGNQSPFGLSTMIQQSFCQTQAMIPETCMPHSHQVLMQSHGLAAQSQSWSHEDMMAALIPGGSNMDNEFLAQQLRAAAPSCYDD